MQEGWREGRVVTEPVTLRGKLRSSKHFSYRTVINVSLVQTEISYLVDLHNWQIKISLLHSSCTYVRDLTTTDGNSLYCCLNVRSKLGRYLLCRLCHVCRWPSLWYSVKLFCLLSQLVIKNSPNCSLTTQLKRSLE